MKITEQVVTLVCDACGNKIEHPIQCHEGNTKIITKIEIDIWYGGIHVAEDLCASCNDKLMRFLLDNGMMKNFHRKE